MKVTMIGAGYVGLVSSACFADFGHQVTCVDHDPAKLEALNAGRIPIYEPGLDALVASNFKQGRLVFTGDLASAVASADIVFIAVGTPSRRGDGYADLTYVEQAAREIARAMQGFTVVVTKSTAPVGTGDDVERVIRQENPEGDFTVVSNPEFLREGSAIEDFKRPDRIVIGTTDERARKVMQEIYRPLYLNASPMVFTERRTAELTKYASNAFLAMKVTFINEIADLCERVGANVQDVARGIGMDRRIGAKFLHAGPGYGGSCFPKDTVALIKTAQDAESPMRLVETTVAVNDQRKRAMAQKVLRACGGTVRDKTIGVLGLTFKQNTDDMREAPALNIIQALQHHGARIQAYDPAGMAQAAQLLSDVAFCTNPYEPAEGADALVIITEWDVFRSLDLERLRATMASPVLVDLRNIYDPEHMRAAGFTYESVGRGSNGWMIEAADHAAE